MNEETKIENLTKIEKSTSSSSTIHSFQDYEIIKELPAGGAEADNFLIQKNHIQFFLKLYRKGINPNIELLINLKELSQKLKEHVVEIFDVGLITNSNDTSKSWNSFPTEISALLSKKFSLSLKTKNFIKSI
jgi:DNA-binding transcriptional regulator GbsR (MarR family)